MKKQAKKRMVKSGIDKQKDNLMAEAKELSRISTSEFNTHATKLGDGLSGAALAYLALIIAFADEVKNSVYMSNLGWLLICSVTCFAASIVAWIIDYILALRLFHKDRDAWLNIYKRISEASSQSDLRKCVDKANVMNDKSNSSSSEIPKILQVGFFAAGLISSSASIIYFMLS